MKIHGATMPDEEMLTFDRWLRRRRKGLDLTQEQLAERVNCSVDTIRKIEAGERRPSQQIAGLLAGALQIAPDQHALFIRVARMNSAC
jgi:transcriptional regulator with XRE-family HTH domain